MASFFNLYFLAQSSISRACLSLLYSFFAYIIQYSHPRTPDLSPNCTFLMLFVYVYTVLKCVLTQVINKINPLFVILYSAEDLTWNLSPSKSPPNRYFMAKILNTVISDYGKIFYCLLISGFICYIILVAFFTLNWGFMLEIGLYLSLYNSLFFSFAQTSC